MDGGFGLDGMIEVRTMDGWMESQMGWMDGWRVGLDGIIEVRTKDRWNERMNSGWMDAWKYKV